MNLLLDTHFFLWYITGDKKLPQKIITLINNSENNCFVSIASLWEIAIKLSLDKLKIEGGLTLIEDFLEKNDVEILPITFQHTKQLHGITLHHRDPFDRMIIAQAVFEGYEVVGKDEMFDKYGIKRIWK